MDKERNGIDVVFILDHLEELLSKMLEAQKNKAQKVAQSIVPGLTSEDLLNPDNFPAIMTSADYIYEDGIAAGILSAKIAVRAALKEIS